MKTDQKSTECTRMGNYTLSHQGTFQGRHICLARDDQNKTYTCKRRTGAELNHIRKVQLALGKCSRVLPIMNVVNTGSVLTESYTFQDQIRGSLADLVARKGPLPEMLAARIIRQVLQCLNDCHSKGVVIQDLELDHFVITSSSDDRIYLHDVVDCDIYHPDADHDAPINPFTAPEVMMSSQHTTTSNVWSAGVMLYVLLSQHWPFFGNTKEELIQSIFSGQYFVHPCWSYELRHLFHCMLSVQPSRRLSAVQILRHPWFRLCEAMEMRHKLNLRSSAEQQYTRSTSEQQQSGDADK